MRDALDRYYTPDALARACVDTIRLDAPPEEVLEPSIGGGAFARAASRRWPSTVIWGVDLDPKAPGLALAQGGGVVADALSLRLNRRVRLCVGNPPYRDVEAHIRAALANAEVVGFLLRISVLGSVARRALWAEHPPSQVQVVTPRPSFRGGGSDTSEYVWIVWGDGPPVKTPEDDTLRLALPSRLGWLSWDKGMP